MAEEDEIRMSTKEAKRVGIIEQVDKGEITQVKAGGIIGITDRQVRRILERYREEGIKGLIHRSRGHESHNRITGKDRILKLCNDKYPDFGPTFACEKLWELNKVRVNRETLRLWLIKEQGEHEWRRKERPHKKWRERKEYFGEMVQMDGSHHDWLEGRGDGSKIVLMGYVDDATGKVYARFYEYEGVIPAFDSMYRYIEKNGVPRSVYLDKHSTYKTTRHQSIIEQLMDEEALTEFERGMKELGVKVIHANSAQAKGRVENRFKTFQDRLVKEMRLAGIKRIEEANRFLDKYLPKFNKRFAVPARSDTDLHGKMPSRETLDGILCIKEEKPLRNDSTIRYKKKAYLITNRISRRVNAVILEERLNGKIYIRHKDRYLNYKEIEPKVKVSEDKLKLGKTTIKWRKYNKNSRPAKDHPWRTYRNSDYQIDITDFDNTGDELITADLAKAA